MTQKPTEPTGKFQTLEDAAAWMLKAVQETGFLTQWDATDAMERFGTDEMWYRNELGSACISRKVLYRFKKISPSIVFDRDLFGWMPRADEIHMDAGRGQKW